MLPSRLRACLCGSVLHVLLAAIAGASPRELIFDSGWISPQPSIRSAIFLGRNISTAASQVMDEVNRGPAAVVATTELIVGLQYLTLLHELGHGRAARSLGGRCQFLGGDSSWWSYATAQDLLKPGAAFWRLPATVGTDGEILLVGAGFNAEMRFAEAVAGDGLAEQVMRVPARLAACTYSVSGELDDLATLAGLYGRKGIRVRSSDVRTWQAMAFVMSGSTWSTARALFGCARETAGTWAAPEFYTYLNADGLSLRIATSRQLGGHLTMRLAYERIVIGSTADEVEIALGGAIDARTKFGVTCIAGVRGLGGSIEGVRTFGRFSIAVGVEVNNPRTLAGARATSDAHRTMLEPWVQLRCSL